MGNGVGREDISPAELDALWREPPYALEGSNEHFPGNYIMTKGSEEGEEVPGGDSEEGGLEPVSYWKRKEALLRSSTVSLGVGERFFSEIALVFSGRRRSTEIPDSSLQEALRTRLRVVESNSQDVIQLFKDLSARLVSVHAEKDRFLLTFKTVEEVWKFSTYLALGYVARCLENFLFDQTFWLDPEMLSDLEINVSVDEEHLATLYLGLLVQEGSFFAKALCRSSDQDEELEVEEELSFQRNDLLMVRDTGQEAMWEGTLLSTGTHGLVPVKSMQPLPYPFYQWFLRKYPGMAGCSPADKEHFEHPIVSGTCMAVEDYSPLGQDELQLSQGDVVEIRGLLVRGLDMFIGTHTSSGTTGFIRKSHVRPLDVIPLDGQLVFLTEDERAALAQVNPCSAQPSEPNSLLERLFSSDISSVYRLDRLDDCDFMFIRNRPKQDHKGLASARQSLISERSAGTPSFQHHHSTYSLPSPRAPVSPLARPSRPASYHPSLTSLRLGPAEPPSFIRDDPFRELDEFQEDPALFLEDYSWEAEEAAAELSNPTLNLLDHPEFQEEYAPLYDLQHSFLEVTFGGQNEEELLAHLENVREAAKRSGRPWAHRRACFLLGRLCARRHKYSQARVYYEESLNVNVDGFSDTPLLTALYINLTAVYLKQRMTDKLPHTLEKACAMLLCSPRHSFTSLDEVELLNVLLRRSVVQGDKHLEARVCYLALSLFLALHKTDDALPFIERLQFLMLTMADAEGRATVAPLDLNWLLSQLYHRKYMPFLALASLSLDSRQDHSLLDTFHRVDVFIRNSGRLNSRWREGSALLPAHIVIYLQQALAVAEQGRDWETQRDLCLGLASVYQQYGALEKAVGYAQQAVETGGYINAEEGFQASVQLGWLLVLTGQTDRALDTLQPLLTSLQGTDSPTQRGVIHNLLALCLRRQARVQEAGRHLHSALAISRESGNQRNQALALANLGCLAIDTGASCLAERYLIRSLRLFWDLAENPSEEEHVQTYMWLGRSYKDTGRSRDARACYELGLLIALHAKNLHGQMVVAKVLSRLYADMLLYAQSIIYYEHCVSVSRQLKDKRLEGEYLEILSNLYLSLNTEKSSRKSLDYTKQSLRISIDLGKREEESETWLQVGRIYYLIHEDELADMYLQAAVKTALRMNDPHFAMSIYEEAGDVFFKGHRGRMASLPFFRDGSLPFARSIRDVHSEFRLLSKLTELLMTQGDQQEALQYATLAAQIASKTGVSVNERTAYHRLATVYYRLQQYEMAENYYLKSLSLCTSPEVLHPIQARYFTKVYTRLGDITLYQLKDAFDAVGYFHLALAAALEDRASPRALYVVYMKLAEIHAHHLPDPRLLKSYRDRAHSLSRILAGEAPPRGVAGGGTGETGGGSRGPGDVARLGPTTPAAHCQAARRAAESEGTEERVSGDGAEVSGDSGAEAEEDSARSQTETEWADCLGGDEEDEERRRRRRRRMEGLAEGRGVCNAILLRSLRQSASESTHTESFATAREYVTDPGPYDPQGDADRTDNGLEMSSHANNPADPASGSEPNQHSDADTGNISHGASGEIDSIPVDTPSPTKMVSGAKTGRRVDNTCDRDADVCKGVTEGDINVILSGGGAPASPSNMDQKLISDILSGHAAIATAGNSKTETVSKAMDALNKHMESDHMNT